MVKTSLTIAALLLSLTSLAYGATMKNPDIKLNPNPRMRYEITVTVQNAPGPFDRIEGSVDYKVANRECVPLTPVVGATVVPEKRVSLELTPAGNNVYKGHLIADLMQDEDYFGLGVCHWTVVGAHADFSHDIIDFSPAIFKEDILKNNAVKKYFANESYTDVDMKRVDIGENSPDQYKDRDHTFSITIKAEEVRP